MFESYAHLLIITFILWCSKQACAQLLQWKLISEHSLMQPRYGHQAFAFANTTEPAKIFIYGGKQGDGVILNGIIEVDTQTLQVKTMATYPTVIQGKAFAAGTGMEGVYVTFGGINQSFVLVNDLHVLDSKHFPSLFSNENSVIQQSKPYNNVQLFEAFPGVPSIQGMASTIDPNTQVVYFIGGQTDIREQGQLAKYSSCIFGYSILDKTWFLASSSKNCYAQPPEAPGPRAYATAFAYKGNIYYFGGSVIRLNQSIQPEPLINFYNDLWRFNLQTGLWKQLKLSGVQPLPRDGHTATIRGSKVYIFGGRTCQNPEKASNCSIKTLTFLKDLWSLDLENCTLSEHRCSWTEHQAKNSSVGAPVARAFHQAVALQSSSEYEWDDIWIIAGVSSAHDGGILGDIWTLRFPPNPDAPAQVNIMSAADSQNEYIYTAFRLDHLLPINFTNEINAIFKSYLAQLLSNAGIITQEIELVVVKKATSAKNESTLAIYAAIVDLRQTYIAVDTLKSAPLDPLQQLSNVPEITLLQVGSGELGTFEQTLEMEPSHPSSLSVTIIVVIVVVSVLGFVLITAVAAIVFWKMSSKQKTKNANHPTSDDDAQLSKIAHKNTQRLAYSIDRMDTTTIDNNNNIEKDDEIQPAPEHS
ncbi:hypothetical protein GpartN1_g2688.t1 [Galdieria partita]|uniref:Kelch repeat-containing protein n=1 Tax=Galdieria partita TaxID=83374 RepID=A0A9C7UPV4_9RHOD|nr:hypothetical protein GpartN1_g2688.t1 [Galdieria partita]